MKLRPVALAALAAASSFACKEEPKPQLAPVSSALTAQPATVAAQTFTVDSASSKLEFTMDAELEKISGRAPNSAQGELFVDLKDVTKSSGLIKVDLDQLSIYQQKRTKPGQDFSPEAKNEKQNADMRAWFEIAKDAPADVREQNRWAEFKIKRIAHTTLTDVSAKGGGDRSFVAAVVGDFRLHGRVAEKTVPVAITVHYEGDKPQSLRVVTTKPWPVGLEEHDVRPRSAFSKLADKTLDALGAKVAKVAQVTLDFNARAKPAP
jgi:hypothetical protein